MVYGLETQTLHIYKSNIEIDQMFAQKMPKYTMKKFIVNKALLNAV